MPADAVTAAQGEGVAVGVAPGGGSDCSCRRWRREQGRRKQLVTVAVWAKQGSATREAGLRWLLKNQTRLGGGGEGNEVNLKSQPPPPPPLPLPFYKPVEQLTGLGSRRVHSRLISQL